MTKRRRSVTDNFTAAPIGLKTYQSREVFIACARALFSLFLRFWVHTPTAPGSRDLPYLPILIEIDEKKKTRGSSIKKIDRTLFHFLSLCHTLIRQMFVNWLFTATDYQPTVTKRSQSLLPEFVNEMRPYDLIIEHSTKCYAPLLEAFESTIYANIRYLNNLEKPGAW